MKRIESSMDRVALHHARNLLEAEGIHAIVRNDILSSAMGEIPPAECQIELWVLHDADAERAAEILRSNRSAAPVSGPAWACIDCGERGEPQFHQCWRCGAYRPA